MQNSELLSSHKSFTRFIAQHWDALLASVLASWFLYFLTRHSGVGVSPDSVEYITVAENIRRHGRIADFTGEALVLFPAGYPSLLAACMFLTSLDVLQFAPVLNGILLSGVLFLASIIIRGHEKPSAWYKLFFLLALVPSRCLLQAYSMLWSETAFIFLTLLFIVQLRAYMRAHGNRSLIFLSVIVSLALVTRYAGITLLAVGNLLLLADGENSLHRKLKHLLLFNTISISLLAANLIRNRMVSHSLTGVREEAERSLADNLADISNTLGDWLPFLKGHTKAGMVLFSVLVVFALVTLCYRMLQQQFFRSYETIVAAFFLVYASFIVIISTISRFEQLNSRLLLPMYIPFLLVGSSWIIPILRRWTYPQKTVLLLVLLAFYTGFHYHQYEQNAAAWEGIQDSGVPGYTEDDWTRSETIAYIKQHKNELGKVIFANANDAVFFLTGIRARMLPHKDIKQEADTFLTYPFFCVIMFTDGDNPDLVSITAIKQHKKLLRQEVFSDGAIYYFGEE